MTSISTMTAAETTDESAHLLVVADAWCDAAGVCEHVWRTVGDLSADVFVVSPALTGRLHSLTSDIDGAVAPRRSG